ncbi:MAG TPA: sulfite exporter TauE/SafE family protein [Azospira sp.]|nr:sulfite exporter TauE/SafE family protein [Azospira sp.]
MADSLLPTLLSVLLVGFLGGTHCIGMCGGIVGALSLGGASGAASSRWPLHLAYNIGRIASYGLAGLLAGALGAASTHLGEQWALRIALYVLANLMLVALGLYLLGATQALAWTERAGQGLWRRLQPFTKRFLPARSAAQAFPLGVLWGWLPCGLVYSVLTTALVSGSPLRGGAVMLAFGLGTLPNLLLAGLLAARLKDFVRRPLVRAVAGLSVLGFGLWGLLGAWRLAHQL